MAELRKDPLSNRWVICSEERGARPTAAPPPASSTGHADCPFCPGNERETLPEIESLRAADSLPDAPGWRIRIVPNKYPALHPDAAPGSSDALLFARQPGFGHHEVIIEGDEHTRTVTQLEPGLLREAFHAYRARFRALSHVPELESAVLIKNVGFVAGASIEHSHSQLIATPVLPPTLERELSCMRAWRERTGTCLSCAVLEAELHEASRIVVQGENLVALCPFASRFAYETWILPARCESHFEATNDATLDELADLAGRVLRAIEACLDDPPTDRSHTDLSYNYLSYNYVIHTAPFSTDGGAIYHWRFAIMPRITQAAGYEQSTGLYINPILPEQAARKLRASLS